MLLLIAFVHFTVAVLANQVSSVLAQQIFEELQAVKITPQPSIMRHASVILWFWPLRHRQLVLAFLF